MIWLRWTLPLGSTRYAAVTVTALADIALAPLRIGQQWLGDYAAHMQRAVFR